MKKICILLLTLLLVFTCSCGKKETPGNTNDPGQTGPADPGAEGSSPSSGSSDPGAESAGFKWSEYTFTEVFTDEATGLNPLIRLSVSLPKLENCEEINHYFDDLADRLRLSASEYLDMAKNLYEYAGTQQDGIFTPYEFESSFKVTRNDGKVFSVVRYLYQNTGGVHPNVVVKAESFDANELSLIIPEDVFSVSLSDAFETLSPFILAQMDERSAEAGAEDIYYPHARMDLLELWENRDFYFADDSLVLVWQTYSLAPYAAGTQEFSIPLADISSIIDPRWLP